MAVINYNIEAVLGTAAELAALNPVLANEQLGKEVDTGKFKIGNGVLPWASIEYHTTNNTLSVYLGASTEASNLIAHSTEDGGIVLTRAALDTSAEIAGVLDGSLSLADQVTYAVNHQHKLATLLMSVYIKRIVGSLGANFSTVFTAQGYEGQTVQDALTALQNSVSNLSNFQASLINDTEESAAKTWSSQHISSTITTAVQALKNQLVGNAGEALDTIYELANALSANSNYITTLLDEVGKSVKFTEQTLTSPQKDQARANIGAASAALVGTYAEIGDQTLTDQLGSEPGVGETPAISLAELVARVTGVELKTYMFNCSMYKSNFDGRTGQYRTIEWKRQDGSLAASSVLSNERAASEGLYTTRTETFYAANGTTVVRTVVYTLTYDNQNVVVSEVIQSIN